MRIKQRGRPREFCMKCRPLSRRPYDPPGSSSTKTRRWDFSTNDTKRKFQAKTSQVIQEIIGQKKLETDRSFSSLCNDQRGSNSQLSHLMNTLLVKGDQYIGFDLDGEIIIGNEAAYSDANWFCANMCSEYGLRQMSKAGVRVVDYDACGSFKNPLVIGDASALFQSPLLPRDVILMLNIRSNGIRDERFVNYNYDQFMEALYEIPGCKDWECKWTDTYVSDQDGATYRTVILVRI